MDPAHPLHATAHAVFYDHPRVPTATHEFDVPASREWTGWARVDHGPWRHWGPADSKLPDQGWKVHVSATHANADAALQLVAEHCHDRNIAFKFLRHNGHLESALAKDADRSRAGKFITLYPPGIHQLRRSLVALDRELTGSAGPYILSDLRWNEGPLYLRYGAFKLAHVWHQGSEVPAIRDLRSGLLVPDVRGVAFAVPEWVRVPAFIDEQMRRLDAAPPDGFPTLTAALHHSNAGGVYAGTISDGRRVVVKEARPHTGHTPDGRDAIQRIRAEARALQSLPSEVASPEVVDELTVHGHHFLVMQRVEGRPLSARVATDNPLGSPGTTTADLRAYGSWARMIGQRLHRLIVKIHQAGHTHGDLHPGNVLVTDDDSLSLIDFEMSVAVGTTEASAFGVPGFVSNATPDPVLRDHWAVACIEMHLLLPLTPLLHLDYAKATELPRAAAAIYGLPAEWVEDMTIRLRAGITRPVSRTGLEAGPLTIRAVRDTLLRDATPSRGDRLWPGDPRQFQEDSLGLAHGAVGVSCALAATGHAPDPMIRHWIARELDAGPRGRYGLMNGIAGAAWGCRTLGWDGVADRLFEQLYVADLSNAPDNLYSGLAGIALALLSELNRDPRMEEKAREIVETLDRHWRDASAPTSVTARSGGLLGGSSGTALLALALNDHNSDDDLIRVARTALQHDVQSLIRASDGTLHLNEGWRTLPYLGWGSAGVGLVLARYLAVQEDAQFETLLEGIIDAATTPFTAQVGLLQGRAGLMLFLSEIRRLGRGNDRVEAAIDHHEAALTLHAVHDGADVRFAGDGLLRASCDVATGAAGVLLALSHLQRPRPVLWPSSTGLQISAQTGSRRGGEFHGVSALTSDTRAR